ncbi:BAG domain-containing protein starvin isoform X1 [Choristoneura fumiferana]|uniref:BAG domain-containing protein starvin isoform X1 n=1 Tax=Choristoneura fumiferana TaxID=7141 RepID=UPI003D15D830
MQQSSKQASNIRSPRQKTKMPLRGNSFRGFPFDEEEGSGAWSSLAARHPDIAARLRQRPATWARKRRPSSQDAGDDFGDRFGDFDRFPFDDIPPEFRDHFPTHWGRRFEEPPPQQTPPQPQQQPAPASPQPHQTTAATQTELPSGSHDGPSLPQYGLRNTVDLGQKSATDPSVDADERSQRSMSAPPAARAATMSHPHEPPPPPPDQHSNVRHIPIFVEGRDEPVINRSEPEPKQQYGPPHVDRDQYFTDEGPATFHHPPNFSRAFGTPFNKGFRQGPQPFTQQKAYPQTAFTRGASPQRSQSPKAQPHPEEQYAKHEPAPRAQPPHQPPQQQPPQQQPPPPQQPHAASPPPPPKPQPSPKDPITLILSIQTDVLNLMSEVENFVGTKKDKKYIFLDEMLTRNLIKLDNIETEGKDNIRQARKEAIKCIEKCIAVLEAKADGRTAAPAAAAPPADPAPEDKPPENGELEMKENTKEEPQPDTQEMKDVAQESDAQKTEENAVETKPEEIKEEPQPQAPDTRPENRAVLVEKPENKSEDADKKGSPKKSTKVVKKRDKSRDKNKDSPKEEAEEKKVETMQVDDKGDKTGPQQMEVDGAAASQ